MKINVEFNSLEEITEFTKKVHIAYAKKAEAPVPAAQPAPTVQPAPQPVHVAPAVPQTQPPSQPVASAAPVQASAPAPQPVPTTAQSYTQDELAKAAMTLMDTGRQAELQSLLASFGVEALPVLPKEQYGAFATALRGMGAQI